MTNTITRKCDYCGKEYIWKEGQLNWGKNCPKNGRNTILSSKYCCYKCGIKARTKKTKETNLKKWGTTCTLHCKEISEKVKKINLERYGTEIPMKCDEIKDKVNKTMLERYGVKRALESEIFLKKAEETTIKNYGVKHPAQSKEILKKMKISCLLKYGVENASQSEEIKHKKEETTKKHYNVCNPFQSKEIMDKINKEEIQKKCYITRKKNHSFNISKTEDKIYELLKEKFSNIKRQYKSEKYPFACDFYILDLDLYIEFQGSWHHGRKNSKIYGPYDENNPEHKLLLKEWKNKSNKKQYEYAIDVWTRRDLLKRKTAKENNLNWLEFWTIEEVKEWLKTL